MRLSRFLAPLALLCGLAVAGSVSAQVSVAAACSAQTLPIGYANGTLIQTQNGDLCTAGGGGGGGGTASFTAITSGILPVVAGANKPAAIDLFSSQSVILKDASGNVLATFPISAASLPLPAGAATSAAQTTAQSSLTAIAASVAGATPAGANTIGTVNLGTISTASTAALQSAVAVTAGAVQANRMVPYTAAGVAVDMSTPSTLMGVDGTTIATVANPIPTSTNVTTSGGCTPGGLISTASTNSTNIKASAGKLCGGTAINTTATLAYVRFYNLAAAPTCSSATGATGVAYPIPASTTGAGTVINLGSFGADFSTGIGFCITGGGASTDNTNAVAGVYLNYTFK